MRISDWSSDVCSSDLSPRSNRHGGCRVHRRPECERIRGPNSFRCCARSTPTLRWRGLNASDRKSVVLGKRVTGRVDLGGRRINKQTLDVHPYVVLYSNKNHQTYHLLTTFLHAN